MFLSSPSTRQPPQESEDRAWIERIRRGDRQAFDRLLADYHRDLIRFASYYVSSPEVAEEVVMDVFIAIWRMGYRWCPRGALRAYLYGAVRNGSLAYLRRQRLSFEAGVRPEELAHQSRADELLHCAETQRLVAETVGGLPERRRVVFSLARFHGLSYAEIAAILGISSKTVEKHMGLALQTLRERLAVLLEVSR